jgi:hypothetical protein
LFDLLDHKSIFNVLFTAIPRATRLENHRFAGAITQKNLFLDASIIPWPSTCNPQLPVLDLETVCCTFLDQEAKHMIITDASDSHPFSSSMLKFSP